MNDSSTPPNPDGYRALGIEVGTAQVDISTSLSQYLGDHYRGQWVAIRKGGVVAAGDTLKEAKERSDSSDDPRTLLYVPREGEARHG